MNKEKNIDEYIKDVWGNDTKRFIINSHAEAYIHRLERENQQLKKQKDDVVKFLKSIEMDKTDKYIPLRDYKEFGILLRMLGEIE